MSDGNGTQEGASLVTNRTVDIAVALIFLVLSGIVIFDSNRLGVGWREGEGPAPGYFPFYIAVVMACASLVNLVRAIRASADDAAGSFVSKQSFIRVLQVFIPTVMYVGLIKYAGIYVASALFIMCFMVVLGRAGLLRTVGVGVGVPLALFFMFERWFLVPLPKGPLEVLFGFN